jgi:hypothetical protein
MKPHLEPPKDIKLVAFVGSAFYECRNHAMTQGKVHVGRVQLNGEVRSTCQSHCFGTRMHSGNFKIIESLDDEKRLCRFCLDKWPEMMHKLLATSPKPKMFYILMFPSESGGESIRGSDFIIARNTEGSIRRKLLNNPEFLRELKNNLKQTGNVKLLKAHYVDVEFRIREVVEQITFKE